MMMMILQMRVCRAGPVYNLQRFDERRLATNTCHFFAVATRSGG